jgi:hypothetical protein
MLQYFYDRNDAATSIYGKKGSPVKISDVRRELKEAHGLKQQQVVSNLNYLIDRGWVKEHKVEKAVTPRGGTTTVPSVTSFYAITAPGIDRIEGGSDFERSERYSDINVTATARTSSRWATARSSTPSSTTCVWSWTNSSARSSRAVCPTIRSST